MGCHGTFVTSPAAGRWQALEALPRHGVHRCHEEGARAESMVNYWGLYYGTNSRWYMGMGQYL